MTTERNFFFKLSRYAQPLLDHYRNNPGFVYPPTRMNEVVSFVEQGLRDLLRLADVDHVGHPLPRPSRSRRLRLDGCADELHLRARLRQRRSTRGSTTTGRLTFSSIGKDIIRFHAVYWPAFLMAAGLPLPKRIVGHGWWLRDNQKISKSLGNVVRPYNIIDEFGADPLRYFLLREMVFGQDQNYSDEAFLGRYNADLANDLGNTLSRAIKMTDTYFGGRTPPTACDSNELLRSAEQLVPEYLAPWTSSLSSARLDAAWKLLVAVNGYIVSREPWKKFKESGADETLSRILWNTLEAQRIVWVMMAPFMPSTTREALSRLGSDPDRIGLDALKWGGLPAGAPVRAAGAIFPRIDIEAYIQGGPMEEKRGKPWTGHENAAEPVGHKPPRGHTAAPAPRAADRDHAGGRAGNGANRHRSVHGNRPARRRCSRRRARSEIEKADEDDRLHRRRGAHHRRRHRHEVRARGARGTEDRHRGQPAARQADGHRVERHGPGRVDRRRAVTAKRRCRSSGRDEGQIAVLISNTSPESKQIRQNAQLVVLPSLQ